MKPEFSQKYLRIDSSRLDFCKNQNQGFDIKKHLPTSLNNITL